MSLFIAHLGHRLRQQVLALLAVAFVAFLPKRGATEVASFHAERCVRFNGGGDRIERSRLGRVQGGLAGSLLVSGASGHWNYKIQSIKIRAWVNERYKLTKVECEESGTRRELQMGERSTAIKREVELIINNSLWRCRILGDLQCTVLTTGWSSWRAGVAARERKKQRERDADSGVEETKRGDEREDRISTMSFDLPPSA